MYKHHTNYLIFFFLNYCVVFYTVYYYDILVINMALYYLGWDLLALEERVGILERRLERRLLRDSQNPYNLPRNEFLNMFRVSPE